MLSVRSCYGRFVSSWASGGGLDEASPAMVILPVSLPQRAKPQFRNVRFSSGEIGVLPEFQALGAFDAGPTEFQCLKSGRKGMEGRARRAMIRAHLIADDSRTE